MGATTVHKVSCQAVTPHTQLQVLETKYVVQPAWHLVLQEEKAAEEAPQEVRFPQHAHLSLSECLADGV